MIGEIFIFGVIFMKENRIKVLRIAPFTVPEVCVLDNHLSALQEAVSIGADYVGLIEVIALEEDSTREQR